MPDLTDTIETVAGQPHKAEADGTKAESHKLPELIEASKHLQTVDALSGSNAQGGAKSGWGTLRPARAIPPGAV